MQCSVSTSPPKSDYLSQTLLASCDGSYIPINFRYHKGLRMVLDAAQYRE